MKRFSGLFLLVFFSASAFAQHISDTIHINEVRVLGKKRLDETGLSITRLDSLALQQGLTTDLPALLSEYTSVFIKSYGQGSVATASFRGMSAAHTQLLWNGMNLNSPMRGSADLSLLPVFFVDDVFLLHGGSSLTEGSGALGGSINLSNKASSNQGNIILASIETGSFSTRKGMLKVQLGTEKFKSVSRIFHDQAANNFTFYNVGVIPSKTDTLKNANYRKNAFMQEFYLHLNSDFMATFRVWYQQGRRNLPQLMSYEGANREEYQHDDQLRVQFELRKINPGFGYHFISGINNTRLLYFRQSPDHEFVNDDALSRENSFLNRFKADYRFSDKLLLTGSAELNLHQVDINDRVHEIGYKKERAEGGLSVNLNFRPNDRLGLFLLSRTEFYDRHFVPFVPVLGAEWQYSPQHPYIIKLNFSRNYHKPGLNDLYWIPGGNSELLPENGYSAEVGWSTQSRKNPDLFRHGLSLFLSAIDNWIIWQPAMSGAYYWEAANIREVLSRGAEYHFTHKFAASKFTVQTSGNYSFTRTSNLNSVNSVDESRGKQLIYIPKHKGNLHAWVSVKEWMLGMDLNYTGRRYTQSSNTLTYYESVLNPFWLTAVSVRKKLEINNVVMHLKATAENIFNINYQQILWRPMPLRHYSFTVSIEFKNEVS